MGVCGQRRGERSEAQGSRALGFGGAAAAHMPLVCSTTSSRVMAWSDPAKSFSSVRNSMQWHSCGGRTQQHRRARSEPGVEGKRGPGACRAGHRLPGRSLLLPWGWQPARTLRSRMGTQGQFQKPISASAACTGGVCGSAARRGAIVDSVVRLGQAAHRPALQGTPWMLLLQCLAGTSSGQGRAGWRPGRPCRRSGGRGTAARPARPCAPPGP